MLSCRFLKTSWFGVMGIFKNFIRRSEPVELLQLILDRYKSANTRRQYEKVLDELAEVSGRSWEEFNTLSRADAMHFIRDCRSCGGQKGRKLGQETKV